MDPYSGKLYTNEQVEKMSEAERKQLVTLVGTGQQARAVSRSVARDAQTRGKADPVRKLQRQQQRTARRRNR